jgi:uncharacterized protein (TIGR02996 family)
VTPTTAQALTPEQAFRRAVAEVPGDDLRRLAFADWLDEHAGSVPCPQCMGTGSHGLNPYELAQRYGVGTATRILDAATCGVCAGTGAVPDGRRERAEFIRVQVKLARIYRDAAPLARGGHIGRIHTAEETEHYLALRNRERELRERHAAGWFVFPGLSACSVWDDGSVRWFPEGDSRGVQQPVITGTVSRGFVGHIACPLAALVGPCVECEGAGQVPDSPTRPGACACSACGGSGLVPTPAARELFGGADCQPVTGVRVGDREPMGWTEDPGSSSFDGPLWFSWLDEWNAHLAAAYRLPRALLAAVVALPGVRLNPQRTAARFDSPDAAHLALGAAVVGVLRKSVGLPALA